MLGCINNTMITQPVWNLPCHSLIRHSVMVMFTCGSRMRWYEGLCSSSSVSAAGLLRVSGRRRPRQPAEIPLKQNTINGMEVCSDFWTITNKSVHNQLLHFHNQWIHFFLTKYILMHILFNDCKCIMMQNKIALEIDHFL